jgi:hypothetical protein
MKLLSEVIENGQRLFRFPQAHSDCCVFLDFFSFPHLLPRLIFGSFPWAPTGRRAGGSHVSWEQLTQARRWKRALDAAESAGIPSLELEGEKF